MVRHVAPDEKLIRLRALWACKRGVHPLPAWSEFSVPDLKPWFGHLALIALTPAPICRLCGDNLVARFGLDLTRHPVADIPAEFRSDLLHGLTEACARKAPFAASACIIRHGTDVMYSDLFLPLSENGTDVTMLLFASYPDRTQRMPSNSAQTNP